MRQFTLSLLLIVACLSFGPVRASQLEPPSYSVVHGWPRLPEGYILGQAVGVGIDSHKHVFVFHRAGREWSDPMPTETIQRPTIMVFDGKTGEVITTWGQNTFAMPHGLTIDHEDNVWVTDVALHQVFKFTHDGKLEFTIGERGLPGADANHFNLPTDVAVLPDGSFYVSDGYTNTRVVKFSGAGKYTREWGTKGAGPGQFDLPHGIAVDANGRVYVADRTNARIQIFDSNGKYITEWKGPQIGRPYSVALGPDGHAFIIDGGDQPSEPPDRSRVIEVDSNGAVLRTFGRFGNYDGQFVLGHDISVDQDGTVYVVDAWGNRVQKFIKQNNR